ncbi:hypothetical protein RBI22_15210 [Alcaligenaceae bacterium C4P045]|nr:hypothetical protein [Alcaligenaceae bacterium C4P045]
MPIKSLKVLQVTIRRDAQTITPTSVLEHELPVLRAIYGKENVQKTGTADKAREVETDQEYKRLADKYGMEALTTVYGDEESGRLDDSYKVFAPPSRTAAEVNKNGSQDPVSDVLTAADNGIDPDVVTRNFDPAATPAGGAAVDPHAVKVDKEGANKVGAAKAAAKTAKVAEKPATPAGGAQE